MRVRAKGREVVEGVAIVNRTDRPLDVVIVKESRRVAQVRIRESWLEPEDLITYIGDEEEIEYE